MAVLSAADHEHFIEHGYIVVSDAVPEEMMANAVEALASETDDRGRHHPAVVACTTDKVLDAIAELFGDGYTLERRRSGSDMPRPHQPDGTWQEPVAHVDDSYPTTMPNGWAIGSFIFLTRVQSRGGAFVVFPGSYRRYRELLHGSCHCMKGAAQMPGHSGPGREFLAAPGDVLLFHHLTGHTGSDNISDPVTRHALLSRWHPQERIVPGDKSFDQMTAIEKVNSTRFLAQYAGWPRPVVSAPAIADGEHGAPVPDAPATTQEQPMSTAPETQSANLLTEGFRAEGGLATSATLHLGHRLHLLGTTRAQPRRLRHWCSETGLDWTEQAHVLEATRDILSLQLHQYDLDAVLAVTDATGLCHLSSSQDLIQWQQRAQLDGCRSVSPWFVYGQYPSKIAAGQAVFQLAANDTGTVYCRWGAGWDDASTWEGESAALRASGDDLIEDVTVAAHVGDSACTFVVDVRPADPSHETRPWFVQPADVAVASEALAPLAFDAPSPPRRLRIVNRARNYWLVTYLRLHEGEQRLFWGAVDFSAGEPILSEISTLADLERARAIVGFI